MATTRPKLRLLPGIIGGMVSGLALMPLTIVGWKILVWVVIVAVSGAIGYWLARSAAYAWARLWSVVAVAAFLPTALVILWALTLLPFRPFGLFFLRAPVIPIPVQLLIGVVSTIAANIELARILRSRRTGAWDTTDS